MKKFTTIFIALTIVALLVPVIYYTAEYYSTPRRYTMGRVDKG